MEIKTWDITEPCNILGEELLKILEALRVYQKHNPLHNDIEAYLFALGEWALGVKDVKPDPEDYGIED
jgi:hypothetical protein